MNITELIKYRKSVRSWANKDLRPETVEKIIDAARFAPSARNCQDWRVLAVDNPDLRRQLADIAGGQRFVGEAPVVLAICGDSSSGEMSCRMPRSVVDATILIDHITLVAAAEGLGTCWIGSFDQDACRKLLRLPEGWNVVELLPLGYPADPSPVEKSRNSVRDILNWNSWDGKLQ
ncbi:MAG: nitroreductase family protein [Spirochaetaceae bacterium]|nr:nitroreductase family protein [Spirochaetaceae bacterium]